MTDVQLILTGLADSLHDNQISEDECLGVIKALRGVPPEHHMSVLKSFLGIDEPDPEPETQPEDYAIVKTFDSREYYVGDEVTNGRDVYIYYGNDGCGNSMIFGNGNAVGFDMSSAHWHRTGRNFPAVAAILEELKKGVDKSAQEG